MVSFVKSLIRRSARVILSTARRLHHHPARIARGETIVYLASSLLNPIHQSCLQIIAKPATRSTCPSSTGGTAGSILPGI